MYAIFTYAATFPYRITVRWSVIFPRVSLATCLVCDIIIAACVPRADTRDSACLAACHLNHPRFGANVCAAGFELTVRDSFTH